jgi:preprotein translocase SecE subunit
MEDERSMKSMAENNKRDLMESRPVSWAQGHIESIKEFYTETRHEMQRVTWPTRKQVQGTTIVVIVTVFFFGAFFMLSDNIVGAVIDFIFRKLAVRS